MTNSTKKQTFVRLRINAGLTQRQVAEALGVTETTIRNWESGLREPKPTFSVTEKLMELYNCSIHDLVQAVEEAQVKREQKLSQSNSYKCC